MNSEDYFLPSSALQYGIARLIMNFFWGRAFFAMAGQSLQKAKTSFYSHDVYQYVPHVLESSA